MGKITIEGDSREDIAETAGLHMDREEKFPEELRGLVETNTVLLEGAKEATRENSDGQSRGSIKELAGLSDKFEGSEVGKMLRGLESHDLVAQEGHRWRYTGDNL